MRNSKTCPKCKATDIVRIPMTRGKGGYNWIFLGMLGAWSGVGVTRYLCASCGYIEEWVDSADDRARIKATYLS
jgi:transposase-like protein